NSDHFSPAGTLLAFFISAHCWLQAFIAGDAAANAEVDAIAATQLAPASPIKTEKYLIVTSLVLREPFLAVIRGRNDRPNITIPEWVRGLGPLLAASLHRRGCRR